MERYEIVVDDEGNYCGLIPSENGPLVQYADAQATIAALQARVQELEEWVQDQSTANLETMRHVDEMQSRAMDAESQLTQRTAECDALKLVNDTHMKTVMKLSHVVEQRTAELEAAKVELNTVRRDAGLDCGDHSCLYAMNKTGMRTNGGCRCSPKRTKDDLDRSRKACDNLQAELERVRADNKALDKWRADVTMALQRPEGAFFVDVPQHIKDLVAELERVRGELVEATHNANVYQSLYSTGCMDRALLENELRDIRTLVLALPKVEGEIEVCSGVYNFILLKHDSGNRFLCGQIETEQTAKAIAALWQHRQGREG